jgi:uroporphyrinogen-III synthase
LDLLRGSGANPRSIALFTVAEPRDHEALLRAVKRWQDGAFDWTIFTSANAVRSVMRHSRLLGASLDSMTRPSKLAAVGPITATALVDAGLDPDYVAKVHTALSLADELSCELTGKRVFLPRSERANPDLPEALKGMKAEVTEVVAYRPIPEKLQSAGWYNQVLLNESDAVLFHSPSAVHILTELLGGTEAFAALQTKFVSLAIGPATAAALRGQGITNVVTSDDVTPEAVVKALGRHFAKLEIANNASGATHG